MKKIDLATDLTERYLRRKEDLMDTVKVNGVTFHSNNIQHMGTTGDNFNNTWGPDDKVYFSYCDGNLFPNVEGFPQEKVNHALFKASKVRPIIIWNTCPVFHTIHGKEGLTTATGSSSLMAVYIIL